MSTPIHTIQPVQPVQPVNQATTVHSEWKNESKWGFLGIGGRNKCTMEIRGDGNLTLSLVHQTWVDRIASLFIKNPNSETIVLEDYQITKINVNVITQNINGIFNDLQTLGKFNDTKANSNKYTNQLKDKISDLTEKLNITTEKTGLISIVLHRRPVSVLGETRPAADAQPEAQTEAQTEAKTGEQPEAQTEAKTGEQPEAERVAEPEAQTEAQTEAERVAEPEAKTGEIQAAADAQPEAEPEAQTVAGRVAQTRAPIVPKTPDQQTVTILGKKKKLHVHTTRWPKLATLTSLAALLGAGVVAGSKFFTLTPQQPKDLNAEGTGMCYRNQTPPIAFDSGFSLPQNQTLTNLYVTQENPPTPGHDLLAVTMLSPESAPLMGGELQVYQNIQSKTANDRTSQVQVRNTKMKEHEDEEIGDLDVLKATNTSILNPESIAPNLNASAFVANATDFLPPPISKMAPQPVCEEHEKPANMSNATYTTDRNTNQPGDGRNTTSELPTVSNVTVDHQATEELRTKSSTSTPTPPPTPTEADPFIGPENREMDPDSSSSLIQGGPPISHDTTHAGAAVGAAVGAAALGLGGVVAAGAALVGALAPTKGSAKAATPVVPVTRDLSALRALSLEDKQKRMVAFMNYFRENPPIQEGIFRESGDTRALDALTIALAKHDAINDQGNFSEDFLRLDPSHPATRVTSIDIASVMKQFLVACDFQTDMQALVTLCLSNKDPTTRIPSLQQYINTKQPNEKELLKSSLFILGEVADNQEANKMTAENLGKVIIGPFLGVNLLRDKEKTENYMLAIAFISKNRGAIFDDDALIQLKAFQSTEFGEVKCITPAGAKQKLDDLVKPYDGTYKILQEGEGKPYIEFTLPNERDANHLMKTLTNHSGARIKWSDQSSPISILQDQIKAQVTLNFKQSGIILGHPTFTPLKGASVLAERVLLHLQPITSKSDTNHRTSLNLFSDIFKAGKMQEMKARVFLPGFPQSIDPSKHNQYNFTKLTFNLLNSDETEVLLDQLEQRQKNNHDDLDIQAFIDEEKLVLMEKILEKAITSKDQEILKRVANCVLKHIDHLGNKRTHSEYLKISNEQKNFLDVLDKLIAEHEILANDFNLQKKCLSLKTIFFAIDPSVYFAPNAKVVEFIKEMRLLKITYLRLNNRIDPLRSAHNRTRPIQGEALSPELVVLTNKRNEIAEMIKTLCLDDPLNEESDSLTMKKINGKLAELETAIALEERKQPAQQPGRRRRKK